MTGSVVRVGLPTPADHEEVRDQQRQIWDAVAPGWSRWYAVFEDGAAPITAELLRLAAIGPGQKILDVGTGLGETARVAADRVGSTGRVVGIDLSREMIADARRRSADHPNLRYVVGAVEIAELPEHPFDAALSRWALPFAADRVAMLRSIRTALAPGGVLAAAVWAAPGRAPVISMAFRSIAAFLELGPPPEGRPGPFAMCSPGQVEDEFAAAGFTDVAVAEVEGRFTFPSVSEFARFSREVLPPGMRDLIATKLGADQDGLWEAVCAAAEPHRAADGAVVLPSTALCIRAAAGSR